MDFIADLGLFVSKAFIVVISIGVITSIIASLGQKNKGSKGKLSITKIHDDMQDNTEQLESVLLDKQSHKKLQKEKKQQKNKQAKLKKKQDITKTEPRVFVLDFIGDIKASAVKNLRQEISALLTVIKPDDEVLLRLESTGGVVHGYGLASAQLDRLKQKDVKLTIAVDKVAASGGYMMACIANHIIAAPFAILGSVGVMAQLPNINKLLKKHDVDIELHTAGQYKRTLTVLGKNTEEGRNKFIQDIQDTHTLFKDFVKEHRPNLEIDAIATGEIWYGKKAIEKQLIDDVMTSDEYILDKINNKTKVYQISWEEKKKVMDKFSLMASNIVASATDKIFNTIHDKEVTKLK